MINNTHWHSQLHGFPFAWQPLCPCGSMFSRTLFGSHVSLIILFCSCRFMRGVIFLRRDREPVVVERAPARNWRQRPQIVLWWSIDLRLARTLVQLYLLPIDFRRFLRSTGLCWIGFRYASEVDTPRVEQLPREPSSSASSASSSAASDSDGSPRRRGSPAQREP